ncbi:MAG: hypothetical protein WA584_16150 [Pyrinomonadaceae bacterium]
MPYSLELEAGRRSQWTQAALGKSQLMVNCLDSIDAALWLIAGDRIPQAVVMLQNAVEIAFKSELEGIHKVLIVQDSKLDWKTLKSLFKEDFQEHPNGHQVPINDLDIERTITFDTAFTRVKELYPAIENWKKQLDISKKLRNDIVHYGASGDKEGKHVEAILEILFPFLQEFLFNARQINIELVVTKPIFREIQVAKKVCDRLLKKNESIDKYVLKTVSFAMFYQNADFPNISDIIGRDDYDDSFILSEVTERQIGKEWNDFYIKESCFICDSSDLFVKVNPIEQSQPLLAVLAVKCPHCGLEIDEEEKYLAEYHVGELTSDEVDDFFAQLV